MYDVRLLKYNLRIYVTPPWSFSSDKGYDVHGQLIITHKHIITSREDDNNQLTWYKFLITWYIFVQTVPPGYTHLVHSSASHLSQIEFSRPGFPLLLVMHYNQCIHSKCIIFILYTFSVIHRISVTDVHCASGTIVTVSQYAQGLWIFLF